jgi:hypothetical protein
MESSKLRSVLQQFAFVAIVGGLCLFIREKYGLDGLRHALPYLIGIPFAFGIILLLNVSKRIYLKETNSLGRLKTAYATIVGIAWIVGTGLSLFQHWMSPTAWHLIVSIVTIVVLVAPPFMRRRQVCDSGGREGETGNE